MVYNDYELVSTKRVGNSRRKGMILGRRQYTAAGGNLTLFTTLMGGFAGNMLRVQKASYIPMSQPMMTSGGASILARNGLVLAGPTLAGFAFGVMAFGDAGELKNLVRNFATYSREMKSVKDQHYCR